LTPNDVASLTALMRRVRPCRKEGERRESRDVTHWAENKRTAKVVLDGVIVNPRRIACHAPKFLIQASTRSKEEQDFSRMGVLSDESE
jgi:hypothetical protein